MHDYCDTRYGELHLIKDTSFLQGGLVAVIPVSIDRGDPNLTYSGAKRTYGQQEYVI